MAENTSKLLNALEFVRTVDADIKVEVLATFLYVARRGQATRQDVANAVFNGDTTSAFRALQFFGRGKFKKNLGKTAVGLAWLETAPDEIEPRRHVWRPTPKGQEILSKIDAAMSNGHRRKA